MDTTASTGSIFETWRVELESRGKVTLGFCLQRSDVLPFPETVRILHGVANLLALVHSEGSTHGAMEMETVLWHDADLVVKRIEIPAISANCPMNSDEDIYAFGILAYRVLTGVEPDMTGSVIPVNALRKHQPPGLARLIMRCLSPEPEERPVAAELRDRFAVLVTPAQNYRARHLLAQAEYMLRRGDATSIRGAGDRFRRAASLDPNLSGARGGLSRVQAALLKD